MLEYDDSDVFCAVRVDRLWQGVDCDSFSFSFLLEASRTIQVRVLCILCVYSVPQEECLLTLRFSREVDVDVDVNVERVDALFDSPRTREGENGPRE